MQEELNLTSEDLVTEVTKKGITKWNLNRGDAQCLAYATHVLWNMDSIECCGMVFDQETIRHYLMDRFNPESFKMAVRYVNAGPGSGRSYWVAATIFLFLAYDDVLKKHFQPCEQKEEPLRYTIDTFLSGVKIRYHGKTVAAKRRFQITKKTDSATPDQDFGNTCRDKRDIRGRAFIVPNAAFQMDLTGGEIIVYSYLLYCEDRKTFTCYPSYETIGGAVGMSKNTVRKYVRMLEQKGLIETSPTTVVTKKGEIHNGSLKYHIRPIAEAEEGFDRRQMKRLQAEAARERVRKALGSQDEKHGNSPENGPK